MSQDTFDDTRLLEAAVKAAAEAGAELDDQLLPIVQEAEAIVAQEADVVASEIAEESQEILAELKASSMVGQQEESDPAATSPGFSASRFRAGWSRAAAVALLLGTATGPKQNSVKEQSANNKPNEAARQPIVEVVEPEAGELTPRDRISVDPDGYVRILTVEGNTSTKIHDEARYVAGYLGLAIDAATPEELAQQNGVADADKIFPGKVFSAKLVPLPPEPMIYTVQEGDTLTKIAAAHNTTVTDIAESNLAIEDVDKIQTGQKLVLLKGQEPNPNPEELVILRKGKAVAIDEGELAQPGDYYYMPNGRRIVIPPDTRTEAGPGEGGEVSDRAANATEAHQLEEASADSQPEAARLVELSEAEIRHQISEQMREKWADDPRFINNRKWIVFDELYAKGGMPLAGTAGIMGNTNHESQGHNPYIENFQGSGATGLAQWLGGRLDNMYAEAERQGIDMSNEEEYLRFQVRFLMAEMQQRRVIERDAFADYQGQTEWDALQQIDDAALASHLFQVSFERMGMEESHGPRVEEANSIFGDVSAARAGVEAELQQVELPPPAEQPDAEAEEAPMAEPDQDQPAPEVDNSPEARFLREVVAFNEALERASQSGDLSEVHHFVYNSPLFRSPHRDFPGVDQSIRWLPPAEVLGINYEFHPGTPSLERHGVSEIVTALVFAAYSIQHNDELQNQYPGTALRVGDLSALHDHVSHNGSQADITSVVGYDGVPQEGSNGPILSLISPNRNEGWDRWFVDLMLNARLGDAPLLNQFLYNGGATYYDNHHHHGHIRVSNPGPDPYAVKHAANGGGVPDPNEVRRRAIEAGDFVTA